MGVSCKVRQTMGLGFGRAVGGERSRLRFMYMVSLSWTVNMIGRFVGNLKDMSLGEVTTGGSVYILGMMGGCGRMSDIPWVTFTFQNAAFHDALRSLGISVHYTK